jgi:hypothetical protein
MVGPDAPMIFHLYKKIFAQILSSSIHFYSSILCFVTQQWAVSIASCGHNASYGRRPTHQQRRHAPIETPTKTSVKRCMIAWNLYSLMTDAFVATLTNGVVIAGGSV